MPTVAFLPADVLIPPPHGQQNKSLNQHDQQKRPHNILRRPAPSEFVIPIYADGCATTASMLRKRHQRGARVASVSQIERFGHRC